MTYPKYIMNFIGKWPSNACSRSIFMLTTSVCSIQIIGGEKHGSYLNREEIIYSFVIIGSNNEYIYLTQFYFFFGWAQRPTNYKIFSLHMLFQPPNVRNTISPLLRPAAPPLPLLSDRMMIMWPSLTSFPPHEVPRAVGKSFKMRTNFPV